jgi:SPP1 family predicted phage head-tail adaptor
MSDTQTFNDGVVTIYGTKNTAPAGGLPVYALNPEPKETLRYEERTVGIQRFYTAMQNKIRIDMLLRCPRIRNIATQDIAIPIDGKQYEIKQVQYPPDVEPPVMDLSLERLVHEYDIAGV